VQPEEKDVKEIKMDEDFLKTMWHEYCARDGFCVPLRVDLRWDKEAFSRLTEAMRRCCKAYEIMSAEQQRHLYEQARHTSQEERAKQKAKAAQNREDDLEEELLDPPFPESKRLFPDWLAEEFWFLSDWVRDWTSHEAWDKDRAREPEYFNKAYERLDRLAIWFFTGYCPWMDEEKGWASTSVS
jgi:hypothetical protein